MANLIGGQVILYKDGMLTEMETIRVNEDGTGTNILSGDRESIDVRRPTDEEVDAHPYGPLYARDALWLEV
jgi:hypothetical protein